MSDLLHRLKAMAATITDLPPLAPKRAPFNPWFRMMPGQRTPIAIHVIAANLPLVRAYNGWGEMRCDVVSAARIPGLYVEGLDLTAMGGEPYSIWN